MSRSPKWSLAIFLILVMGGWGCYQWEYPYGYRTCRMPCVALALRVYAADHDGWFPKGKPTPLESLALICPSYTHFAHLAGISGNDSAVVNRMTQGGVLDESISSWIYWPGLRDNDDPGIATVWERTPGIGFNGRRMNDRRGHMVGYVDGTPAYVPSSDWNSFLKKQEEMRRTAFEKHAKIRSP